MKKIITLALLLVVTITSYAQALGYQDLALLFSQDDLNGTARFKAMGGAFGALGGDISSINVNPAGLAVFNNSSFTGSFNVRNTAINSNYFGTTNSNQDQFFNLSQAGAVLVFRSNQKSDWTKFAFGVNYRLSKDFRDSFLVSGNSNVATFRDFPEDRNVPALDYNVAEEQRFFNDYNGETTEFNLAFSAVHNNKLHLGASLNFYDLNFSQQATLTEFNNDGNGNTLDASLYQENFTTGTGVSLNAGFIYKASQFFRFGLSYQTPTWYSEVIEESNIVNNDGFNGDVEIAVSESNLVYDNTSGGNFFSNNAFYRFRTPSKLTTSTAFVFGKNGLLSLDYVYKNFNNVRLSGQDFSEENNFFQNELRNTHSFNVGGEWRFDRLSLRAGYRTEQSPDVLALESDNLSEYSFGGGYNFGNFRLDFAYSNNNRTAPYNFYAGFNVDAANLNIDNRVFTATVSISL